MLVSGRNGLITHSLRPPDKSAYFNILIIISRLKHMLWVLKSQFLVPKLYDKTIITIL